MEKRGQRVKKKRMREGRNIKGEILEPRDKGSRGRSSKKKIGVGGGKNKRSWCWCVLGVKKEGW